MNFSAVEEQFNMDALDNWTTTIGLVQSVVAFIEKTLPGITVHVFYHAGELHEYREIDREGIISIPDDSLLIGCLSMVSEPIPLDKMFSDFHIDDPTTAQVLEIVYGGRYIVPVVHGFDLLAFLLVCTEPGCDDAASVLPEESISFLAKLSSRLQVNLYAATIAGKRQRELLQMAHFPLILQKHESVAEVYTKVLEDLLQQLHFDKGVAYAYHEASFVLRPCAFYGIPEEPSALRPGQGISGQVFERNMPLFVPSRLSHPAYSIMPDEEFIDGSFVSVPFGNDKMKMGVITLVRKVESNESFSVEHQYMLEVATAFIASEITNRLLFGKLEESNRKVVSSLAGALEAKDKYTEGHSERVAEYSVEIARSLGYSEKRISQLRYGAVLHDIGKIGISDNIVNKPGRLTESEYSTIKSHAEIGYKILDNNPLFDDVKNYVRYHHEKLDGSGYYGKHRGEYPEESMIISCADIYDALTTDRPYRKALSEDIAFAEMKKQVGVHFTKEIYDALYAYIKAGRKH